MLRVFYSNRLESLIAPLVRAIARERAADPLTPSEIIMSGPVIEQYVKFRLAESLGVAASLRFEYLVRYLADRVRAADPEIAIAGLREIQLLVFERFRDRDFLATAVLRPVRDYVEVPEADRRQADVRAFRLAGQVARLFAEYSLSRPELLRRWQEGSALGNTPFAEAEAWQRHLWKSIFAPKDRRLLLLPEAFDRVGAERLELPRSLHVFGLAYAAPEYLRMLAELGRRAEVAVYALNPCHEFWEDVRDSPGVVLDRLVRRRRPVDLRGSGSENEDPFGLVADDDTPALRLWGRPGREYVRILSEATEFDFEPHFTIPGDGREPTLLERLQRDILNRAPQRPEPRAHELVPDDGTIRVLACPGIRREVEIVANEIWSLVCEDDAKGRARRDRLRFHEIAVLIDDRAAAAYLPHVETAFAALHGIPLNVVNRPFAAESRVAEAVTLLLELPFGRLGRLEMVRLLTHPAIAGADADADREKWQRWCDRVNVVFGADSDDLEGTYIGKDLYHWDSALRRLALGAFLADEQSGEQRVFEAGDGRYLPYESGEDSLPALSRLLRVARSLSSDARRCRDASLTLPDWAEALRAMVRSYVCSTSPGDDRVLRLCLDAIEAIGALEVSTEPVPYGVVHELLAAEIAAIEEGRGRLAGSGVAVGTLSSLRSIPFRAIFVLGLGEGEFPARAKMDPIDLRLARRRAGDVTPTERDRYLFFETLLAARERLTLSYVSREAQTGDRLEPSTVLKELEFILRTYVGREAVEKRLTVAHPVSRYDERYFADFSRGARVAGMVSFDPKAREGARLSALRRDLERHAGSAVIPGDRRTLLATLSPEARSALAADLRLLPVAAGTAKQREGELSLSIAAVRRFLECPVQGAARAAIGMRDDDADEDLEEECEPLALSALDRAILLRRAFWQSPRDVDRAVASYAELFSRGELRGVAPTGPFAEAALQVDGAVLEDWVGGAAAIADLERWEVVRVGQADEYERVDRLLPPLVLELPGAGRARVRLSGVIEMLSPARDAAVRCVARERSWAKDFLGMALGAVVLTALGEREEAPFRAILLQGAASSGATSRVERVLASFSRETARGYLEDLLVELLYARHDYFLPIEAVEAVLSVRGRGDAGARSTIEAIEDVRADTRSACSADHGPVRAVRKLDPPSEPEVMERIERRFGLIYGIFGIYA